MSNAESSEQSLTIAAWVSLEAIRVASSSTPGSEFASSTSTSRSGSWFVRGKSSSSVRINGCACDGCAVTPVIVVAPRKMESRPLLENRARLRRSPVETQQDQMYAPPGDLLEEKQKRSSFVTEKRSRRRQRGTNDRSCIGRPPNPAIVTKRTDAESQYRLRSAPSSSLAAAVHEDSSFASKGASTTSEFYPLTILPQITLIMSSPNIRFRTISAFVNLFTQVSLSSVLPIPPPTT